MASNDIVANDEDTYNKEYRRLRTLTSQTDILESSVSFPLFSTTPKNIRCNFLKILSLKIYTKNIFTLLCALWYIKLMGFIQRYRSSLYFFFYCVYTISILKISFSFHLSIRFFFSFCLYFIIVERIWSNGRTSCR